MSEVGSKSMQNKVKHFPEMCLVIGLFKVLLQLKNRCRGLHVATALFCHAYERVRTVFFFFFYAVQGCELCLCKDQWNYHRPHQNQHQLNQYIQ